MDLIEWNIPGSEDIAAGFGPLTGGPDAWTAMETALLDGWVVSISTYPDLVSFRRELRAMARSEGRALHLHAKSDGSSILYAWWS
jgi:hypothetical protein